MAKLFISYSLNDKKYRDELAVHLSTLLRQKAIETWHNGVVGTDIQWQKETISQLHEADIVLVLLSPDYLASEYVNSIELSSIVDIIKVGNKVVLPVILRRCDWHSTPFANIQALPMDGKPISSYNNQDQAFEEITDAIRTIALKFNKKDTTAFDQTTKRSLDDNLPTPIKHRTHTTVLLPDIDWVEIPAGNFIYGENKSRKKLYLDTFYMSRYPITNIQYKTFIDDKGYEDKRWWHDIKQLEPTASNWTQSNRPKINVSWYEAIAFTRWLSFRFGYEVRLPTEQEWEKVASASHEQQYPWGNEYSAGYANVNDKSRGGDYLQQTTAVGVYPQGNTDTGVADLAGNVWEWCLDKYETSEKPTAIDTSDDSRVLRGGSWLSFTDSARAPYRFRLSPVSRDFSLGFRVVCVLPFTER